MNLVNLTPHEISLADASGNVVRMIPSTGNCRVVTTQKTVGEVDGFPINKTTYGQIDGLPAPNDGTMYIVSILVAQLVPDRDDVVAPDTGSTCVREGGQIKAVRGFVRA